MSVPIRYVCWLAAFAVLFACASDERGRAHWYRADATDPLIVEMPAGALYISQQFYQKGSRPVHAGIDILGPRGTPVLAAAPGRVVASYYEPLYGNRIRVDHGSDAKGQRYFTQYFHLDKRLRKAGDVVRRGEQIGTMGSTGALGLAVHLHFEVHQAAKGRDAAPEDPHHFWAKGVGKVTCFEPVSGYPTAAFAITYPTPCS